MMLNTMRSFLLVLVANLGGCGVFAPAGNAGFADLDSLGLSAVDNTMTLSIGPSLLGLAAMHTEDDPQARALLENLDGVRVKTYDVLGDQTLVAQRIGEIGEQLQGQGWVPVVTVQEAGERTLMLMKLQEQNIVGLVVLTCDASEAVIVNVMGDLQPEMFSRAMLALDTDVPPVQVAQHTGA